MSSQQDPTEPINVVITFLVIAAVVFFFVVKPVNGLMARFKPTTDQPAPTRDCPYCKSSVAIDAMRCAFCTSELTQAGAPPRDDVRSRGGRRKGAPPGLSAPRRRARAPRAPVPGPPPERTAGLRGRRRAALGWASSRRRRSSARGWPERRRCVCSVCGARRSATRPHRAAGCGRHDAVHPPSSSVRRGVPRSSGADAIMTPAPSGPPSHTTR